MRFKNPQNGYIEEATTGISWLWVLLWAPIYYAAKGIWPHAVVSLLLALVIGAPTFGAGSLLVGLGYAFFNKTVVRNHYLKHGWVQVDG